MKVLALVAGMIASADSIDDLALLQHCAMGRLFTGVRGLSTLGTFLRSFTFGHVRQFDAVASRLLINLSKTAPLLPGAGELAYVDIDDTVRPTYGYAKERAGRGYSGMLGLNALVGIVSTPGSGPVITGVRLRRGQTNNAKGAPVRRRQHGDRQGRRRDRGPDSSDGLGVSIKLMGVAAVLRHKPPFRSRRGCSRLPAKRST